MPTRQKKCPQNVISPDCGFVQTDDCFTKLRQQHMLNEKQFYW